MSEADQVREALKREVVPLLREMGFKGSFPHHYRRGADHTDLVWFSFGSGGTSFVVELSYADASRENVYIRPETPPNKLRVAQTKERHRLGSGEEGGDFWFAFAGARHRGMTGSLDALVAEVGRLLQAEGERWWQTRKAAGSFTATWSPE